MKNKIILGLLTACLSFSSLATAKETTYTFGVVPQQAANVLANRWVPLTQYISKRTGLTVNFATAANIPTFESRLADNAYDIAYMNPFHYVVFSESSNYAAIANQADKKIQGVIVAKKDSNIESLTDLQGSSLAFPAPGAFAATLLPQAELKQSQIEFTPRYVSSHDSVYLSVAKGFFMAGGGVKRTLNNMPDNVLATLKVIYTTQRYTPHAFAVHNKMPIAHRKAIQEVLTNMSNDPEGEAILSKLGMSQLQAAIDSDWDDVRALNLNAEAIAK